MKENELLELGFDNTSFREDGIDFTEFKLTTDNFEIEISGISRIEIKFPDTGWVDVPNCSTIEDLKQLIKLFV